MLVHLAKHVNRMVDVLLKSPQIGKLPKPVTSACCNHNLRNCYII